MRLKTVTVLVGLLSATVNGATRDQLVARFETESTPIASTKNIPVPDNVDLYIVGEFHNYREHELLNEVIFSKLIQQQPSKKWCHFMEAKTRDQEIVDKVVSLLDEPDRLIEYRDSFHPFMFKHYIFDLENLFQIAKLIKAPSFAVDTVGTLFMRNEDMADNIQKHWDEHNCERGFMSTGQSHLDVYQTDGPGVPLQISLKNRGYSTFSLGSYARDYYREDGSWSYLNWKLCSEEYSFCPDFKQQVLVGKEVLSNEAVVLHQDRNRKTLVHEIDALLIFPSATELPLGVEIPPFPIIVNPPQSFLIQSRTE